MSVDPEYLHAPYGQTEAASFMLGSILSGLYGGGSTRQIEYNSSYERSYRQNLREMKILVTETAEQKFRRLADQWYDEVGDISASRGKFTHPAYREILELQESAVPFILRELLSEAGHWFQALRIITGENPAINARGYDEAVQAWLSWGRRNRKL